MTELTTKKTAAVTGGAGFIGSHICDYLLNKRFRVICIDDLITGSLKNLAHIDSEDFKFINHDITEYIKIDEKVDYIFHFASPASPIDYLQLPIQTLKVGALGTHNVLGLAKAKRAIMILASTSEVYGDPKVHPQPEEYWGNVNPVGPRGVYDEAKRYAEAITMAYHRQQGVNTRIVRIFNTYGPRMRKNDGRAIPAFITQALKGKDITVFGDGSQTRSFCYISDMVDGIFRLAQTNYHLPLNIGNPTEMSILELAKKIKSITGSSSKIVFHDLPVDDPTVRRPDTTKAKKILSWQPRVSFEEGMNKTIKWFKENINGEN
ncbi:MAG: SDR family oxidoreductase [Actinobacteria bacterium]|nr:SDR family oxidoreductase [Actinomycetota bacterium]